MNKRVQHKSLEEELLNLYFNIKSEISPHSVNYEDLRGVNIFQILEYLKQSIEILVNHRIDKKLNSNEHRINIADTSGYEQLIKKLENEVRHHIKIENEMKIHLEYLEGKVDQFHNLKKQMKLLSSLDVLKAKEDEIKRLKIDTKKKDIVIEELQSKILHSDQTIKSSRNVQDSKIKKNNFRSISMLENISKTNNKIILSENPLRGSSNINVKKLELSYYNTIRIENSKAVKIENPGLNAIGKQIINSQRNKLLSSKNSTTIHLNTEDKRRGKNLKDSSSLHPPNPWRLSSNKIK